MGVAGFLVPVGDSKPANAPISPAGSSAGQKRKAAALVRLPRSRKFPCENSTWAVMRSACGAHQAAMTQRRSTAEVYCFLCVLLASISASPWSSPRSQPSSRGKRASSTDESRRYGPYSRSHLSSPSDSQAAPLSCRGSIPFANCLEIGQSGPSTSWLLLDGKKRRCAWASFFQKRRFGWCSREAGRLELPPKPCLM